MTDKRKGNGTGAAGTAQQMVDAAMQEGDINAEVEKLAALPPSVYETKRSDTAKRLGMRASVLDKLVTKKRAQSQDGQGRRVEINNAEPWGEAVDGAALLNDMSSAIRAHIVVTQEQADAVALYSVYTHAYEVFKVAPRLGIRAPTRECGKSELLLRVQRFVSRPLASENLTGPVLFRLIELKHPSLFIDEFDNLLSESKSELLGLLNSGYARDGKTHRLVGDKQYEIREFSTFCPLIYGMIGKPRDSFNSRSIPIEMRRATPVEWRNLLSLEDGEPEDLRLQDMGRMAARWALDNLDKLKAARPDMGSMTNRSATNWRPLFAVAEVAGGEWKARARAAAGAAAKLKQSPVDEEELFATIKAAFAASTKDYIESEALVRILTDVEGGPWTEYGKTGKPITQNALARLLRKFGISPGYVGPEVARRRGYARVQFEEAFASYVVEPPPYAHTPSFNCASVQNAMNAEEVEHRNCAATQTGCTVGKFKKPNENGHPAQMHSCNPRGAQMHSGLAGRLCDHCGSQATAANPLNPWDCEGRPDGIWLHPGCEHAWVDLK